MTNPFEQSALHVGYLLRTFPVLSETFVTGEIRGMARNLGRMPWVGTLYHPASANEGGWDTRRDGLFFCVRDVDRSRLPEMVRWHAAAWLRHPVRQFGYWAKAPVSVSQRMKLAVVAKQMCRAGVTHMHTHFAWEQVDVLRALHRLTGIPYSLTVHAADIFMPEPEVCARLTQAQFVATISHYNRRLLVERFSLPEEHVHVVRCGIDLAPVSPESAGNADSGGADAPLRILSVGRLVPKKGFDVLLAALGRLRDAGVPFMAEIAGGGELRDALQEQAMTLGLGNSVRFSGPLASEEVLERVRQCDVFVLCARRAPDADMDGLPVVLMEAMAYGKPVISSRLSGIPELVDEQCGFLGEPEDAAFVARHLAELSGNRRLAREMGAWGREKVRREFTRDRQVSTLLALIRRYQAGGDGISRMRAVPCAL